jgi:hypothetical protein
VERLEEQMRLLFIPFAAKFGGATGNYNAHHVYISTGENLEEPERTWGYTTLSYTNRTLRSLCSFDALKE